jgi:hypothetical protein
MANGGFMKAAMEQMLVYQGQTVIVHNDWKTNSETQVEVRALKGKYSFEFTEIGDVRLDSVLQVKGGSDYWRVIDIEENFDGNVIYSYKVSVSRLDGQGNPVKSSYPQQASAVFHGDITGAVQIGGSQNTQTVNIQINTQFNNAFNKVLELIQKDSHLDEFQKEDAIDALQKLPELAKKEPSESVMKRAKEKLDVVNAAISTSKELALIAAPYLIELAKYFHIAQ